jgi:hypothetical protein
MELGYNQYASRCGDTSKEPSLTHPVANIKKTLVPKGGLIKVTLPKT